MITYNDIYLINKDNEEDLILLAKKDGSYHKKTGKQIIIEAEELASILTSRGLSSKSRIGIFMNDSPEWVICFLAIFKINATAILIDKNLQNEELNKIVEQSKMTCICTESEKLDLVNNVKYVYSADNKEFVEKECEIYEFDSTDNLARCVIFSSGTTSSKSGILHKTTNLFEMIEHTNKRYHLSQKDRFITIVPNTHIYGLSINVIVALLFKSKICFLENLDNRILLKTIQDLNPTYISGVPKLHDLLCKQIEKEIKKPYQRKLVMICSSIRKYTNINFGKCIFKKVFDIFGKETTLVSAGSHLNIDTKTKLWGIGFPIIEFYGSTETGVPVIGTSNKNSYTHGIGRIFKQNQVKIDSNKELLVKSPYILEDYINEDRSVTSILNGEKWIKTGDMALKDILGNIHIIGRIKENIVFENGEKITPEDVEYYYRNLNGVIEFVVCGVESKNNPNCDEVHAFIVKKPEATEEEIKKEIIEISKKINSNMIVKKVHFVEEIPKTALGKPRRYMLKQMANEE